MDGVPDIAVGCPGANARRGKVLIVTLTSAGGVNSIHTTIESGKGGFKTLQEGDHFGSSLAFFGSAGGATASSDYINLAVGAEGVDDGHVGHTLDGPGAAFFIRLHRTASASNLSITSYDTLSQDSEAYKGILNLEEYDDFGYNMGFAGDLTGDGAPEIVVTRRRDKAAFFVTPKALCLAGMHDRHYSLAGTGAPPQGGNWTSCTPCPANMSKATDSVGECTACPGGRTTGRLLGQKQCWPICPAGKYSHLTEERCVDCARGKYDLLGGIVRESQCTMCEVRD